MSLQETLAPESTPDHHSYEAGVLALQSLQDELPRPHGEGALGNTWYYPSEHLEWKQPAERELIHASSSALQMQEGRLRHESRAAGASFTEGDVARTIVGMRRLDKWALSIGDLSYAVDTLKKQARAMEPDKIKLDDDASDKAVYQQVHDTIRHMEDRRWHLGEARRATYREEAKEVKEFWDKAEESMFGRPLEDTGDINIMDIAAEEDNIVHGYERKRAALELQAKNQGLEEEVVDAFLLAEAHVAPMPELTEKDRLVIDRALQHSIEDIFDAALANHEHEGMNVTLEPGLFTSVQLAAIEQLHEARQWLKDPKADIQPHPLFVAYHTTKREAVDAAPEDSTPAAEVADAQEAETDDATTGTKFRRIVRQLVSPNIVVGMSSVGRYKSAKRQR